MDRFIETPNSLRGTLFFFQLSVSQLFETLQCLPEQRGEIIDPDLSVESEEATDGVPPAPRLETARFDGFVLFGRVLAAVRLQ